MSAYKVVARHKDRQYQLESFRGKPGTQAKKQTYLNKRDFDKYSPKLITRWAWLMWDVEVYEMDENNKWQFHALTSSEDDKP